MYASDALKQKIKDFVLNECKMDKVGVASIDRFNSSPEGAHPTDFLPGCKSVIAFCTRLPDGAVNAVFRSLEDKLRHAHGIYGAFGYVGAPNYNLMWANYKLAKFIEEESGFIAVPQPAGPTHSGMMMSMRHSAFAAGLGEFGWNSLMLTPEFGPRNRFGAVLTTLELEPDPMYNGPKLCDPKKCHVCEKMCPSHAIPPYNFNQIRYVTQGGKTVGYGATNWARCRVMCHGTQGEFNETGESLFGVEPENPINEDLDRGIYGYYAKNPRNHFLQHNPTWKCGQCLAYCPVGDWKERFFDTGMSSVDVRKMIDD